MAVQPAGIPLERSESNQSLAKQSDPTTLKLAGVVDNILGVAIEKSEIINAKMDISANEQGADSKAIQKMVETVKHPNATWQLFSDLCQIGNHDKALEVAHSLASPQESASALLHMAKVFVSLDQVERAVETTTKAFEIAKTISDEWTRSMVLVSVSEGFMELDD